MGYNPFGETIFDLSETVYREAEVVVRTDLPIEATMRIVQTIANAEGQDALKTHADIFGRELLIRWNLQDRDGNAIPANADGMMKIPAKLVRLLIGQWLASVWAVSNPLAGSKTSSDSMG